MKQIVAYPTHIEIAPYRLGESRKLENMCSTDWNYITHKRDKRFFLLGNDHKLIIPRGINLALLQQSFDGIPGYGAAWSYVKMKHKYKMLKPPKNENQAKSIDFLLSRDKFFTQRNYTQLALVVEPGFGKTFCAVAAAIERGERTFIICHRETIKEQWIDTLTNLANVPKNQILDAKVKDLTQILNGEDPNCDFIICLAASIRGILAAWDLVGLRTMLKNLKCGLKIVDEVHLEFDCTVITDLLANIQKNYYLSATFTRSNKLERNLFNRVFGNTVQFGMEFEWAMNVVYTFVRYNSNPSQLDQMYIMTKRGPSVCKLSEYAFERDENQTLLYLILRIMEEATMYPGKILITAAKIDHCNMIAKAVQKEYRELRVESITSKNSKEKNAEIKENADVIVSTIASLGTGADIKKLRSVINGEAFSSDVITKQFCKRLRPFPHGVESYFWDLEDFGFQPLIDMEEKKKITVKKITKDMRYKNYDNI